MDLITRCRLNNLRRDLALAPVLLQDEGFSLNSEEITVAALIDVLESYNSTPD